MPRWNASPRWNATPGRTWLARGIALSITIAIPASSALAQQAPPTPRSVPADAATPASGEPALTNALGASTSPYLRMHADNPIAWQEWGPEAFARAKREHKPVFLSIGYSTCYWCHVMEHEVFMDESMGAYMNEHFINIKVDREERPDVDAVYMAATQVVQGGAGGWPNTLFLTPDGLAFLGTTYMALEDAQGRPGFRSVARGASEFFRNNPDEVERIARAILSESERALTGAGSASEIRAFRPDIVALTLATLSASYDSRFGGFGTRPKFPSATQCQFLFDAADDGRAPAGEAMALNTLRNIAAGAIHDHVGGGFHRYTTDQAWRVPHFEKMLYDQATVGRVMLEGAERTGDPALRAAARDTMRFVLDRLRAPGGGFCAALDAQTGNEEGGTYLWTRDQIVEVLGEQDAAAFLVAFKLQPVPTLGRDIQGGPPGQALYRLTVVDRIAEQRGVTPEAYVAQLADMLARLRDARDARPQPMRDDKVIVAWNGLMIDALARASVVLDEPAYATAAGEAASFILDTLRDKRGRLARYAIDGKAVGTGVLDDYAMLTRGLLSLHEATGEVRWLQEAVRVSRTCDELFADPTGAYTLSSSDELPVRVRDASDGSTPNGNAVMARAMLDLARLTGDVGAIEQSARIVNAFAGDASLAPGEHVGLVDALLRCTGAGGEVAFAQVDADAPLAGDPQDPVSLSVRVLGGAGIEPGRAFNVVVHLNIAPGWHIGADEPGADFLLPTSIRLEGDVPIEVLATLPPREPVGFSVAGQQASVYAGAAMYTLRVRIPEGTRVAGNERLRAIVSYQACDDRRCLEPAERVLPIMLPLAPPTTPAPTTPPRPTSPPAAGPDAP